MNITFQGSGAGVTAESIGAPAPVCAPKSAPMVDTFGNWQCAPTADGSGVGSSSTLLLLAAAAAGAYFYLHTKHRHKAPAIHAGAPAIAEIADIL